jgi:two-component system sensor histidine kinase UhpB
MRAEAALRLSEERFKSLTELSSDYYWEQDEQFRFVARTDTGRDRGVYSNEQMRGKTSWEIPALNLTPADWAKHRADLEAHRHFRDLEIHCPLVSGEGRWVSVSGSPIFDAAGRFRGYRGVGKDITERKQTEQALHDYARRLQGVSRRLFAVEETERRNINRELHDRIGQKLAALNLNLNIIRSQLPQESLRVVSARLQDTQRLLEETAAQIRDIMADLHPPALDEYGLLAAVRTYVEAFGARLAVPITVQGDDLAPRLSLAAETALFRIAQEALANAAAHARAQRVQITLAATPDRVTLTIADDGAGFDVARAGLARASWGLAIMRERAEAVGATLRIDTGPGRGTRVVAEIGREAA